MNGYQIAFVGSVILAIIAVLFGKALLRKFIPALRKPTEYLVGYSIERNNISMSGFYYFLKLPKKTQSSLDEALSNHVYKNHEGISGYKIDSVEKVNKI